jgi:DNA-binding NtrC family response regulator
MLVASMLRRAAVRDGRTVSITPLALDALGQRSWPGNVRELENALERALVLSGGMIDAEHVAADSSMGTPIISCARANRSLGV